jgi:ABC-type sugar transport system ATPase subunit
VSEYLFEMRNIVKEFSGVKALNGIDLVVRRANASACAARTAPANRR